ncbi:MAG: hypothetical protein QOJ06_2026 [Pseudonocardiales bacterium]|jgi:hypothetical protein|nr:hypothetical protein [Pseudonocardiales bacterium]
MVGTRDGTIIEAHPGETVTCPPGEEHWHGAAPDRFMEHLAMWEGGVGSLPGSGVDTGPGACTAPLERAPLVLAHTTPHTSILP